MPIGSFGHFIKIFSGAGWLMKLTTSLRKPWLLKSRNLTLSTGRWSTDTKKMAGSSNLTSCERIHLHMAPGIAGFPAYLILICLLFGGAALMTRVGVATCCAIFVASILVIVRGYRNDEVSDFLAIKRTFLGSHSNCLQVKLSPFSAASLVCRFTNFNFDRSGIEADGGGEKLR